MKFFRKTLLIIAVLSLCLIFSSSLISAQEKVTIRLASAFEPEHILCKTAEKFKELVESQSGGAIKVELFLGGVMGSEEEITESVSIGAVEAQVGGGLPIKTFAPDYYFFDSPYVMKDWEHFKRVFYGELGQKMREEIEKKGNTMYLGIVYRGLRHFTSNKPVRTPDDVKGIKLRLPQLPTWIAVWKEIGALPVPVPLTELFTALQTGVADASEGDVTQIYSFHLYEVQKYLSLTGHLVQTGGLTINKAFFDKLPDEYKNIIVEAGKEACDWGTQQILEGEEDIIKQLEEAGMTVIRDVDQEAFREKAKPAVEKLFETEWTVTTWEEILSY
ncbi:TRAP transporter substrate-binding protein [Thermatribacter velox]|uniref:TRAP transporter substrate-binding protein n=1 Tax=Thermatribacter velox TaxID=3039681 RepID=A0ABZ2YC72_9BACT